MSHTFGHDGLVAYRKSLEFYGLIVKLERDLLRHDVCLADELRRSARAVSLSISLGSGCTVRWQKVRCYRSALRATLKCSTLLELFAVAVPGRAESGKGKQLLDEIAQQVNPLLLNAARRVRKREHRAVVS